MNDPTNGELLASRLTKAEFFAAFALAGILSDGRLPQRDSDISALAEVSKRFGEALAREFDSASG